MRIQCFCAIDTFLWKQNIKGTPAIFTFDGLLRGNGCHFFVKQGVLYYTRMYPDSR